MKFLNRLLVIWLTFICVIGHSASSSSPNIDFACFESNALLQSIAIFNSNARSGKPTKQTKMTDRLMAWHIACSSLTYWFDSLRFLFVPIAISLHSNDTGIHTIDQMIIMTLAMSFCVVLRLSFWWTFMCGKSTRFTYHLIRIDYYYYYWRKHRTEKNLIFLARIPKRWWCKKHFSSNYAPTHDTIQQIIASKTRDGNLWKSNFCWSCRSDYDVYLR